MRVTSETYQKSVERMRDLAEQLARDGDYPLLAKALIWGARLKGAAEALLHAEERKVK